MEEEIMHKPKTYWADTEIYGLLGNPLRKSLSPAMHNANFESIGMNALYTPWEVEEDGLKKILPALTSLRFMGLNITMPLKQKVIPLLDELDDMGSLCKAINTLYWKKGKLCGTNTDGVGFVQSLKEQGGYDPAGKSCLLFGSGGAARGVSFALCRAGVSSITLSDRASWFDNVQQLASELNAYRQGVCRVQSVDPSERPGLFKQNELIINATSAGMAPNIDVTPFDTSLLESRHMVCDVVYVPHDTKLLKEAAAKGCATLPGYWMMIWQGVEAFRRWTMEREPAIQPDVKAMTNVVLSYLTEK
jgi:shikimate dehydrogenase